MICMGMSGNGCRTSGMKVTAPLLQMGVRGKTEVAPIGFLVDVAGSVIPISAVQLVASSANLKVVSPI